jgi:hypothetical protein
VTNILDVLLQLVRMSPAVQENFFHAGIGQELERIFDQRGIGEGEKTLSSSKSTISYRTKLFFPDIPVACPA